MPDPVIPAAPVIEDDDTPRAATAAWALLNLIMMAATVLTAGGMTVSVFRKKDDKNEDNASETDCETSENNNESRKYSKLLGWIPAVGALIVFIITEDMRLPMTITDKWTLLMVVIFAINAIAAYLTRNRKKQEQEEETA